LKTEIKTYRDDNKKLYDINKKYIDENIKYQILQKENGVIDNILLRILKNHPNRELSKLYNEIINQNDIILNFENDNLKFDKVIEHLEKEYNFVTSDKVKRNPEIEAKLLNEINRLKKLRNENDEKIKEKRENIELLEQDLKNHEEKPVKEYFESRDVFRNTKDGNIFKANYSSKKYNTDNENDNENFKKSKIGALNKSKDNNLTVYEELENSIGNIKGQQQYSNNFQNLGLGVAESSVEFNDNVYIPPSTGLYRKTYNVPFDK
jgi:hypothetical protein